MRGLGGRGPGAESAEPGVIPWLAEGVPELQQAGADAAPVVPAELLLPGLPPRVGRARPVVVEGCKEVLPPWAGALRGANT